jgi:hypothetical protein
VQCSAVKRSAIDRMTEQCSGVQSIAESSALNRMIVQCVEEQCCSVTRMTV